MSNTVNNVELTLPSKRVVRAALAEPADARAPGLILIHEWWGLNDEMREVAKKMAGHGYRALAVDLYEGEAASEPARAKELMSAMDPEKSRETLVAWAQWLRNAPSSNGKVGALGYCMGGAWALNTSLATPIDATVVYYGNVKKDAAALASLHGPVQGHFGKRDQAITVEMAQGFEAALKSAGKPGTIHIYDADHAFSRVGGPNFDAAAAALAEQRTLEFLSTHLLDK